ncbi:glutamine synthetase III family protein [Oribacterium sinus]|uniref:glutamine synthetase III family protein n=1 Tax=Oribacterium sinus TaxID=237576 RepID=UPI0028D6494B|nr:glutamine synthetase III [Oribacterium sinus]
MRAGNGIENFSKNVFHDGVMRERLPKNVYQKLKKSMQEGYALSPDLADAVAQGMKEWAIEQGATHYTHWFQPLSGITAEKHEAFLSPVGEGKVMLEFSGKELVRSEADASSFPSGGLRATFEARGYTVWDCTSPAFLRKDGETTTLCIPTAFCSYTGEALDKKTPLLRSMEAINREALRLLRLFGNQSSRSVKATVGAEQEYFLVDREKYLRRKDLVYTGRTLFGRMPAKGQELDDHYYGVIRKRIAAFMGDMDQELWALGVPVKTEHNEVAPAQHEMAPMFEEANLAVDHNQLVMENLKKVASRHGLECLLHEKPFEGINGSGKHNNWSLSTDDGINLMNPGETPHENVQFLLVLACVLAAVDNHADLLRMSAANVGNDHRLGADEAPPAIISCFLGSQLEEVVAQLIGTGYATKSTKGEHINTGVRSLPDVARDDTDRNRTSPFAFTGNKFEFRMVGSSDSIAGANIILNTITAEQFKLAADFLEQQEDFETAVHDYLKKLLREHERIIFNGNGYGKEWVEEAKRRGLPNHPSMVDAISALTTKKSIDLFSSFGIYTETELRSRELVEYEHYSKVISIEGRAMVNISGKQIIPAAIRFVQNLAESLNAVKAASPKASTYAQEKLLNRASQYLEDMEKAREKLLQHLEEAAEVSEEKEKAFFFHKVITKDMAELREPADLLETIMDKSLWPFPSYGDLLYEVSEI